MTQVAAQGMTQVAFHAMANARTGTAETRPHHTPETEKTVMTMTKGNTPVGIQDFILDLKTIRQQAREHLSFLIRLPLSSTN
jgi:hypothetical protein